LFGLMPMESVAMLAPADESIISAGIGSNRTEDLQTVRKVLEQKIVQQRLQDIGLSQDHINARLDRMSDGQLHAMATQLNSVIPAGGDGTVWTIVGILLIVLLVILLATML
jgi:diacylglycerol kinase family enzyme